VIPVLAILSGLFVIFSQLFLSGPRAAVMSVCSVIITLAGLPVYYAVRKKS
jgi:APA family basic amino acid/polyamine antiporter